MKKATEINNSLGRVNNTVEMTEDRISEFEYRSIEFSQSKLA